MPTASSRPKSRIIGTLAKRRARKAKMASKVTTSSAGPRFARRLLDRVLLAVDDHLLLDARVHLDRVVDAHAEHHRQAGDGDDRERDAEVAGQAERPHDADEDHAEREQPPADVEGDQEDDHHEADGDGAEHEHAAGEVVVEVAEQHRGAGGGDGGVAELEVGGGVLHDLGGLALGLDVEVARAAARPSGRCSSSGKNGRSDLRISPSLSWRRKSFHASLPITRSSGGIALTRVERLRRGLACGPPRPPGVGSRSVAPRRIWAATPSDDVPRRRQHEVVGELEGGERGDDAEDVVAARSLISASTASHCSTFSGVKRSVSVLRPRRG